jgi:hypothetical protein
MNLVAYFSDNLKITEVQKGQLIGQVSSSFEYFRTQLEQLRERMLEVFENTFVFKFDRGIGRSSLFFPKLYEHLQRIAPRMVANEPKWVITPLVISREPIPQPEIEGGLSSIQQEQLATDKQQIFKDAEVAQLYLHYIWNLGNCQEKLDSWSVNGLVMNIGWAKVDFVQKTRKRKEVLDRDDDQQIVKEVEEIFLEYPTFEVVDTLAMYFDPRIEFVDDMRAVIENDERVYVGDLLRNKELYYKEAVEWLEGIRSNSQVVIDSKQTEKFTAQGIPSDSNPIDPYVNVKTYYGYVKLNPDDEDEILVQLGVINDAVVLECKEIPFIPFEKFTPSKIPNQAVGVGALSPILDLHKGYNLTRNQRYDNISLVINRMWMLRRGSGVDPRKLKSLPGQIIDVDAFDSIRPLDTPDVTSSSFNETQALNTEMQTATGTLDTAQDSSQSGFTNLATGQKIRYAEFSSRFKYYKSNLERSLARLGQKMLVMTSLRATQDPVIADKATSKFYKIAKEQFDSFNDFFDVAILADSTSYDSVYNQRDEALAKAEIALKYSQAGVPIDMAMIYKDIMRTFPGTDVDKLIQPPTQTQKQKPGGNLSAPNIDAFSTPDMSSDDALMQSLTQRLNV